MNNKPRTTHSQLQRCENTYGSYLDNGVETQVFSTGESLEERIELRAVADKAVNLLWVLADVKPCQHGRTGRGR